MRFTGLTVWLIAAMVATAAHASAEEMTALVDAYFADFWKRKAIVAAPLATDAEFLRRAALDLTGVVPRVAQVREFLDSDAPNKRSEIVDRLLESPRHATHLANQWRHILLPNFASSGFEALEAVSGTQAWLRERFLRNQRYDRLVGEFLTVTGSASTGPVLYYQAHDFKPEKLAAATARSFFGIQLACAECHDHPFDDWKQEDFWSYAAFFARVQPNDRSRMSRTVSLSEALSGEVTLPNSEQPIAPRFLDGQAADEAGNRRLQLSLWAASQDNPYIARAAVNRVWALMFGRGLSEPVDDLGPHNPPDHPELLDQLATKFIESDYDLRALIRALVNTRVYGLSSRSTGVPAPASAFARMQVKALTTDQLYDSLNRALRHRRWERLSPASSTETRDIERARFILAMSTNAASPTEFHSGLQQTLTLMNGTEFAALFNDPTQGLLAALDAPFFTEAQRVETLFLAILSRLPDDDEQQMLVEQMQADGTNSHQFLADLLWALANSAEFRMNH